MGYDCYCALCCCVLNLPSRFGTNSPQHLARRKKRVRRESRKRSGDREAEESTDEGDEEKANARPPAKVAAEDFDEEMEDGDGDGDDGKSNDGGYDTFDEDHSYDPTIVNERSVAWMENARCLGYNPEAKGVRKAFISGRGNYTDYGDFHVRSRGADPNDPEIDDLPCFYSYDKNSTAVFPFHEVCYKLLCRAIFGHENIKKINKDIMYSTMQSLSLENFPKALDVYYGEITGQDQFWECMSGEEYCVANPSFNPDLIDVLQDTIAQQDFNRPPAKFNLDAHVKNDPFAKLPYDILYSIFPHLPQNASTHLIRASWHVYKSTQDNGFWKQMIRHHFVPWFWELETFMQSDILNSLDCKGLYLWLRSITKERYGTEGAWMGIVNRKRIWAVCQVIKKKYLRFKRDTGDGDEDKDLGATDEAQSIKKESVSLSMPITIHPQPPNAVTKSVQWIKSWSEINCPEKIFESYWSRDGRLVGLAVIINSERRLYGFGDVEQFGVVKHAVDIPGKEWIKAILLHVSDFDIQSKEKLARRPAIKGLSLTLTSGAILSVLDPNLSNAIGRIYNIRPLSTARFASPVLTGVIGQVHITSANANTPSMISRLGILQATPPNAYWASSAIHLDREEDLLWSPSCFSIAPISENPSDANTLAPIWNHPRLTLNSGPSFAIPTRHDEPHLNLLPTQVLLWARTRAELSSLIRVSGLVVCVGIVEYMSEGRWVKEPNHRLVGLRAEFTPESGIPMRTIGEKTLKLVEGKNDEKKITEIEWPAELTQSFEIDGPGGERIVEMHVADQGEGCKAIKLLSNRGREMHWGKKEETRWNIIGAVRHGEEGRENGTEGEGEESVLVGFAAVFATEERWKDEKGEEGRGKVSAITWTVGVVMDAPIREGEGGESGVDGEEEESEENVEVVDGGDDDDDDDDDDNDDEEIDDEEMWENASGDEEGGSGWEDENSNGGFGDEDEEEWYA
ncbi:hypothetical protein B0J11DRAFT_573468 [Dendryphion nanum]|uniref:F-box domain-containing protein n=1 Tax=Dendryphion nanum TaxID=256645 RepID=A0A9P9D059_9PLEO|nr:hypothetical protein B0J11DRAFT_573468 [Dendryphion nanum]